MTSPEVEHKDDQTLSGFKDWTIGKCYHFMVSWNENEERYAEQAALGITCEEYGISYMDVEWLEVVEAVRKFEGKT